MYGQVARGQPYDAKSLILVFWLRLVSYRPLAALLCNLVDLGCCATQSVRKFWPTTRISQPPLRSRGTHSLRQRAPTRAAARTPGATPCSAAPCASS